ncbi:NACHT domain-containing protein [Streptomyces sp. NPDC058371]|uniref:NACHT domain-containing protein n=1 Tax=Streptomyces sp. NPDC058371 TaxID=3346463 RepID=UPI003659ADD9
MDAENSESPLEELARRLRLLRAERRISVTALTSRVGLGRTTVSKALNGSSVPSEETIVALATALRADVGPLLQLREQAHTPTSRIYRIERKRIRQPSGEGPVGFEQRYRQYVARRHEKLSVIGLDLACPDRSCWPLDAAYLSLELAATSPDQTSAIPGMDELERTGAGVRAEQALSENPRVLIRGLAGSGKTTLMQWLAVGAARQNLPKELDHLNDHIPFILPLRTLARTDSFPDPDHYLAAVNCPLNSAQPAGWVDGVMSDGQGLLLIDGVDEVSQDQRPRTREWLLELLSAYPLNQFVVTTRPTAVPDGWLANSGFGELTVQPMAIKDVSVFISRWHDAARKGVTAPEEVEQLDHLEVKLRETVRSQHGLAQMTTTPLLCALVCALHRDRHGHLPHGRMELYAAALSMLLHRRDSERNIQPEGLRLSERQSMRLLQRLAYWMVDNGQTEISRIDALHHIGEALPSMPDVSEQGDALTVLDHLVERSGVLRAPDDDTVDFVHRTFQDYLAAKAAVDKRNIGVLVKHAHDDRWEDIVRMAVAHATPDDADQILRRLVSRGDRNTANVQLRTRLYLLAAACLDYATELDPEVRREVHSRTAALLPPRSVQEAHILAAAGRVIIDLLPGPEGLEEDEAEAVVYTAGMIGGDAAMALLKKYIGCDKGLVPWYMQMHWNQFEIGEYAREVLARMPKLPILAIQSHEQMEELTCLAVPGNISLTGDFTVSQIEGVIERTTVRSLALYKNDTLVSLDFLAARNSLRELSINSCAHLGDLTPLSGMPISTVRIWQDDWNSETGIDGLTQLRTLELNSILPYSHIGELPACTNLTSLDLGYRTCSSVTLQGITRWPNLERLRVFVQFHVEEFPEISNLEHLSTLELFGWHSGEYVSTLSPMESVETLVLASLYEFDWRQIREKFPRLRNLKITSTSSVRIDISALCDIPGLSVDVRGVENLQGADNFPPEMLKIFPRPRS